VRTNAIAIKHVDCAPRKKKPNGTSKKSKMEGYVETFFEHEIK
jgi:hypothetical protein